MGSLKRKDAPNGPGAAKSAKSSHDGRPTKRTKSDKGSKAEQNTDSKRTPSSTTAKIPIISRLKEEEPLFPRGGGSVLTPLEHKEIQIQAKKDVLFEQESGGASRKGDKVSKKKKSRKATAKEDKQSHKVDRDEDAVKIESLNYKRLVKGSLVLGQVCQVSALDVSVALPNNLTGHVPITAISQRLTERIEAEAARDEAGESIDDDVDLRSLFSIGQYLRASVRSAMEDASEASGKTRRRIELSLCPDEANSGLSDQDIVPNCTVMASVASVEDHGYVMDLGIAGSNLRGFLPRKEVDPSISDGQVQEGSVLLCLATSKGANGKIIQLSALSKKLGAVKSFPAEAVTVNTFLPGTAVDVLLTEISSGGLVGKVLGHLDVTADVTHSGAGPLGADLESKYKTGSKIKARVICTFPTARTPKLGISILDHILSQRPKAAQIDGEEKPPLQALPISARVERCVVRKTESDIGLWADVGVDGVVGFVHISRVKDGKVDALYESSGPYKVGSSHRGRVVGYNAMDGVFLLSFEQHILEQPYLRIEDIPVGEVVSGVVEKLLVGEEGVSGLIVRIAEGLSGLVPEMHLADVRLQHPEKKFREGMKVKARVLSTDPSKHQLRLTLKKTLVNSESALIKSFDDVSVGLQSLGAIVNILQNGAVVQFYGSMRGFLPISEMSEAYIHDPKEHFRIGQVVSVHVLDVEPETNKLVVSCKDPAAFGLDKQLALKKLKLGDIVAAKITQKTEDDVFLELVDGSLRATLPSGHLTDKSTSKNRSALKKLYAGQVLSDLVVLDKSEGRRSLVLSQKPSLVSASREGKLLVDLGGAKVGSVVPAFVRNITPTAAFVQFAGNLTALLPKSLMPTDDQAKTDFGLHKSQSLLVRIVSADVVNERQRMVVAIPSVADVKKNKPSISQSTPVVNPLDDSISTIEDVTLGKMTKARVTEVKETQLNVEIASNVQGRIDMSEIFDDWADIPDPKHPLQRFREKQVLSVRVLGVHSARNHTFLPLSHRSSHAVLELSAKPSSLRETSSDPLSLDTIKVGSTWLGFVNNHGQNCLWVSLSVRVRGSVYAMEASDDLSLVKDLAANFPLGSAIRVRVLAVDVERGRLDLSARSPGSEDDLTWKTTKENMVVPGKVTKVNERQLMVQLSPSLAGPVQLVDIMDDYDQATTVGYNKNDIIRVSVVELDKSNKKIRLSTRPSRVLNSSLPVEDSEITKASKIQNGDIIRGFVKNVSDKGLFVNLGGDVTGFVRIQNLSDRYLKEWKDHFQIDQLVRGRVINVDPILGHIDMSLKASAVDKDYVPLLTLADLKDGQVVTGKVRKAEEFGAFILLDNSANVSGLCHRSEMAERPVKDARKLYKEGDVIKAKVLSVDLKKKRINLGMKPSYFDEDEDSDMDVDEDAGAALESDDDETDIDEPIGGVDDMVMITGTDSHPNADDVDSDEDFEMVDWQPSNGFGGLDSGGFDWSDRAMDETNDDSENRSDGEGDGAKKKRRRRKSEMQVDRTGDLGADGPETAGNYESRLKEQPDSSSLWIGYMTFQMRLGELDKARETAKRAIKTISFREETEKLNVWIAALRLEMDYGTDDTFQDVFKRACQHNDEQEVYERAAHMYIQAGRHQDAEGLFQAILKKFGAKSPQVWSNYAHFLYYSVAEPERARALLPRATQMLERHNHAGVVAKFAALEFRSPSGTAERGRTLFEGLVDTYPKKFDLWNQLLDLETAVYSDRKAMGKDGDADPATIRDVFERGSRVKGLKPRRAKTWFQRWARWEEENGDAKSREKVSAKAKEWTAEAERRKAEREEDDEA